MRLSGVVALLNIYAIFGVYFGAKSFFGKGGNHLKNSLVAWVAGKLRSSSYCLDGSKGVFFFIREKIFDFGFLFFFVC